MTISTTTQFTMKVMDKRDNLFELCFIPTFTNISIYHPKLIHNGWKCKVVPKDDYKTYIQEYEYKETSLEEIISEWIMNEYKHTQPLKKVTDEEEYDSDASDE